MIKWFLSGVRFKMNGGEWHSINRYDEAKKQDENIACVGYDPRTGEGLEEAKLIALTPELLTACITVYQASQLPTRIEDFSPMNDAIDRVMMVLSQGPNV